MIGQYALEWTKYAKIMFDFGGAFSDIRVGFTQKGGHWPRVGDFTTDHDNWYSAYLPRLTGASTPIGGMRQRYLCYFQPDQADKGRCSKILQ